MDLAAKMSLLDLPEVIGMTEIRLFCSQGFSVDANTREAPGQVHRCLSDHELMSCLEPPNTTCWSSPGMRWRQPNSSCHAERRLYVLVKSFSPLIPGFSPFISCNLPSVFSDSMALQPGPVSPCGDWCAAC